MECPITLETIQPEYAVVIGVNTYDARALHRYIQENPNAPDPMTRIKFTSEQRILIARRSLGEPDSIASDPTVSAAMQTPTNSVESFEGADGISDVQPTILDLHTPFMGQSLSDFSHSILEQQRRPLNLNIWWPPTGPPHLDFHMPSLEVLQFY